MKKCYKILTALQFLFFLSVKGVFSLEQISNEEVFIDTYIIEENNIDKDIEMELKLNPDELSIIENEIQEKENNSEIIDGKVYPEPDRKRLSIIGTEHPYTIKFRNQYLTTAGKKWLAECLAASEPYRPYIRSELEKRKLPMELQYLPIVESNYKIHAVSRTGATGMWQFMTNSMSPFLKKNNWYDERLDPWKETNAALTKLKDNYARFGDWALALGAYNCGAGAMSKAIKRSGKKDFWYLAEHGYLSSQTANYVPKLLAIADLIENADYYGAIEIGAADKVIDEAAIESYDYIKVTGMISLNQISQITQIPKDSLSFLNPALFRNCTPAGETYELRVPEGKGKDAEEALKVNGIPTDALIYTVKKGDSLWGLSRKYGRSVSDLCLVNNIKENGILSIGQKVIIPIFK